MRRWLSRLLVAFSLSAALAGCNSDNCRAGEPCACRGGHDCYLGCEGDGCNTSCSSLNHCGTVCEDKCATQCFSVDECSTSCGDDCNVLCHDAIACGALCGDRCHFECYSMSRCGVRAGNESVITCHDHATCAVECTGTCRVDCSHGACDIKCLGGGGPTQCGNGTVACGGC
jgi:hypothetical protein